jgi:hypothetical protein
MLIAQQAVYVGVQKGKDKMTKDKMARERQ